MRAKSGQILCERQKGEITGARATVMSFAKTATYQSNTNTNLHPAAYCQVSAALNRHIPILREVSAWSILPWEPGQPKQSCSGAASQKMYPQSHLYCKMLLKKSTSHILRAPSRESPTSFLPCPQLIPDQMKVVQEQLSLKWPHGFRFCTNVKRMYYSDKIKLATTEKPETLQFTQSPIFRVKWNSY